MSLGFLGLGGHVDVWFRGIGFLSMLGNSKTGSSCDI